MAGGFRGPLLLLALAASVQQVGYRSPLPIPPVSGGGIPQAGYVGPLPILNLGAGEFIPPAPEPTVDAGADALRVEDEEILAVIMAYMAIR